MFIFKYIYKFIPISRFKWIDPQEFGLNIYTIDCSKDYVLEVDFENPKESRELHDYHFAPDEMEI